MLVAEEIEAANGWVDPGYLEHELTQAIRAVADQARSDRKRLHERGLFPNSSPADCVQNAIKSTLNLELHAYGLKVVRIPNTWRTA
ncbi:MAG: hypothetical protein KA472_11250 [Pseudomonadales bacterium]|nr:hypothetical protein [Pseudomonadales bacterium]